MVEPQKSRDKKKVVGLANHVVWANPVALLLKCSVRCELALCGVQNKMRDMVVTLLASISTVGAQALCSRVAALQPPRASWAQNQLAIIKQESAHCHCCQRNIYSNKHNI